jgi:hypothetical protein
MSQKRPETGPMKFGDDWTGVFIRGDDALNYALALKGLLEAHKDAQADEDDGSQSGLAKLILKGLVDDLLSSNEMKADRPKAQNLKPFDACRADKR